MPKKKALSLHERKSVFRNQIERRNGGPLKCDK